MLDAVIGFRERSVTDSVLNDFDLNPRCNLNVIRNYTLLNDYYHFPDYHIYDIT